MESTYPDVMSQHDAGDYDGGYKRAGDAVDEIVDSTSDDRTEEALEEKPLIYGYIFAQLEQQQQHFEELVEKYKDLKGKPVPVKSCSKEAFDEEIDTSDSYTADDSVAEKPLLYGAYFQNIVQREEKDNAFDYYVDDPDEDNEVYEEPVEQPLIYAGQLVEISEQQEQLEYLKKKQELLKDKPVRIQNRPSEAFDEELESSDAETAESEIQEKPLLQGAYFKHIAAVEDKENPFDYYLDDPNEDNEIFDSPHEASLVQHVIFQQLEYQAEALEKQADALDNARAEREENEHIYLIYTENALPVDKQPSAQYYTDKREAKQTKHAAVSTQAPAAKKGATFYYKASPTRKESDLIDISKYEVQPQAIGGYVFDVVSSNNSLIESINKSIEEIDEIAGEIERLIAESL